MRSSKIQTNSSSLRGQCGATALLATTGPLGPQRSAEGYRLRWRSSDNTRPAVEEFVINL